MRSTAKILHVGEEKVTFPRLSIGEMTLVGDEIVAERERLVRDLGREEKLERLDIANLVLDVRRSRPALRDIVATAYTPEGAVRILTRSLLKAQLTQDKIKAVIPQIPIPQCVEVAEMLCLDVQDEEEVAEKKAEPTSPDTAATKVEAKGTESQTSEEKLRAEAQAKTYGAAAEKK